MFSLLASAFTLLVNRSLRSNLLRVASVCMPNQGRFARFYAVVRNMRDKRIATVDHFRLWRMKSEQMRRIISFSGATHLQAKDGQKVLILSAHYLGFEIALMRLAQEVTGAVVVELTKNEAFNAELVKFWQRDRSQVVIDAHGGLRQIARVLRSGVPTALLVEHMGPHPNYISAPWIDSMAIRMTPSLKLLLSKPETKVLWLSTKRTSAGHYDCRLDVIADASEEQTKNTGQRITLISQRLIEAVPYLCWNTLPLNYPASMR
jgi:lauroyl/myristoyl acyltransferase